ncbi:ATP-binding cassette domain-containing protein [Ekhidna sp.]|uniref:ATP-binding cassette domain-containing protein n=1 Tax=Ekhidna sp. TaxID=2608089 RepID=UPI003B50C3D0
MLRVISFFFKSSWQIIVLATVGSVVAAGLNLLGIKFLGDIIKSPELSPELSLVYAIVSITLSSIIGFIIGYIVTKHYEFKISNYRKELSDRVLRSNYQEIEEKLDRLVPVLLFEIGAIGGFGRQIPIVMVALIQTVVVIGYLFYVSWQLTLILIPLFLVVTLVNVFTLPMFKALDKLMSEVRFKIHFSLDRLEKGFKNLAVNRTHANSYVNKSIGSHSNELARLSVKNYTIRNSITKSVNAFVLIGFGTILLLSITTYGFNQLQLIEYLALILYIRPYMNQIANFFKQVKNVENALEQVDALNVDIRKHEMESDEKIPYDPNSAHPLVEVDNMLFQYKEKNGFKLHVDSFKVFKNEILIINGYNGSGKSTLFKLITGLYTPDSGQFLFQNQPVTQKNLKSYRDYFSCYFTDSPLFDNLSYLDLNKNKSEVSNLMESLGLSSKTGINEQFEITKTELSNGQKGRLNLLRLLLEKKEIYFFDEWAANQDIYFKEKFYTEIVPGLKANGKTVILISHDDKFYSVADRILTIKDGKLKNVEENYA